MRVKQRHELQLTILRVRVDPPKFMVRDYELASAACRAAQQCHLLESRLLLVASAEEEPDCFERKRLPTGCGHRSGGPLGDDELARHDGGRPGSKSGISRL
jgi:hypothetical protein